MDRTQGHFTVIGGYAFQVDNNATVPFELTENVNAELYESYDIPIATIKLAAGELATEKNNKLIEQEKKYPLNSSIVVTLNSAALVINENSEQAFSMTVGSQKVTAKEQALVLNQADTPDNFQRRGWGRLGLLIALLYGQNKGFTRATLGSSTNAKNRPILSLDESKKPPVPESFWCGLKEGGFLPIDDALKCIYKKINEQDLDSKDNANEPSSMRILSRIILK